MAGHGIPRSDPTARLASPAQRDRERARIAAYNDLVSRVLSARSGSSPYTAGALALTSELLKQNAEFYTVWNYRRQILLNTSLSPSHASSKPESSKPESSEPASSEPGGASTSTPDAAAVERALADELHFLVPLLTSHPKCYWLWNHRLWVLSQASARLPPAVAAKTFWQPELQLVAALLARDARNFHGWHHRRAVVRGLSQLRLAPSPSSSSSSSSSSSEKTTTTTSAEEKEKEKEEEKEKEKEKEKEGGGQTGSISMVASEFAYTTQKVQTVGGLANYSAWHARSVLIPSVLAERYDDDAAASQKEEEVRQARMDFLEDELELVRRMIATNPADQSLWLYHRWLVVSNTVGEEGGEGGEGGAERSGGGKKGGERAAGRIAAMDRETRIYMLRDEVDWLRELLADGGAGREYEKGVLKALLVYTGILTTLEEEAQAQAEAQAEAEAQVKDGDKAAAAAGVEPWEDGLSPDELRSARQRWLERLVAVDPMRAGRYRDMAPRV